MLYRFRKELIARLCAHHEVTLCMPFTGHEDDFRAMGAACRHIDINRRGITPAQDARLLARLRALLRAEHPTMVLTFSIKPNIYAGLLCVQLGIPYCAFVQGLGTAFSRPLLAPFITPLYRAALRHAQAVFFENTRDADIFRTRRIVDTDRIEVLHGAGVNLTDFPLTAYPENKTFRFLCLGRLMREKGTRELAAAMARLHREEGAAVTLDIVGFYEEPLEHCIAPLLASGAASFYDFQCDPRTYLARSDCVILPSYHEGMSNVLLEAAAMGRPIITTDVAGCREAVCPEVSGMLCRARDADDLYRAMKRMHALPRDVRERMGLAARALMEQEFDREQVVSHALAVLLYAPA